MNKKIYLLYHKPRGVICTMEKTEGNIIDAGKFPEGVMPVGRLDKDSEGLIIMTNDGPAVHRIIHPDFAHEKEYIVTLNLPLRNQFLKEMAAGVNIGDAITAPCLIRPEPGTKRIFRIILKQGLNRQIRRMCAVYGYQVIRLQRVRIMHLQLGKLAVNEWRYFTDEEQQLLLEGIK